MVAAIGDNKKQQDQYEIRRHEQGQKPIQHGHLAQQEEYENSEEYDSKMNASNMGDDHVGGNF